MSLQTRLVQRADKVSFMKVEDAYHRMKGFTTLSTSKNPKEYTRQYVDEAFETSDVVGISAAIEFGFDQMLGDPVHDHMVHIIDEELLGADATVDILTVDFTKPVVDGYEARLRSWAVIADTEGDSFDAYTYTGSFRVKSSPIKGEAASIDDFELACTFTPSTSDLSG